MKELNIKEIGDQEINTTLDDVLGNKRVKVYPYVMINTSPYKKQLQPNTTSVVSIGNKMDLFENRGITLKEDKNGIPFFELVVAYDKELNYLDLNTTSATGVTLRTINNFTGVTNHWNGKSKDINVVCFINEPFDNDKFSNREQVGFLIGDSVVSQQSLVTAIGEDSFDDIESEVEEITFRSLESIKNDYINSDIVLTQHDFSNAKMTVDDGTGKQVPGIVIEVDNTALLHSVKTRTQKGKHSQLNDLKLKESLASFKMTPIDNQDNVTMFADWLDYDMVAPLYLSNLLVTPITLSNLQKEVIPGTSNNVFTVSEKELLEDVIALSYAYATRWVDFPVYTEVEAEKITGVKPGQIKGFNTIGHAQIKVETLVGKDPMTEIDLFFETYIRKNPGKETSAEYRTLKQLVSSLSRYIYSSYAIGKGQNSFNQAYLPWYIKPISPIKLTVVNQTNFQLAADITFKIYSEYFEFKSGDLVPKAKENISNVHMIQTERKLTLPSVPDTLNGISKIPFPGDISTSTSRDLMYIWYLPIKTKEEFEKLFLSKAEVVVDDNTQRTVTTPWTELSDRLWENTNDEIKDKLITDYLDKKVGAGHYTIEEKGVLEKRAGTRILTQTTHADYKIDPLSWTAHYQADLNKLDLTQDFTYDSLTTQELKIAFRNVVSYIKYASVEFSGWYSHLITQLIEQSLRRISWNAKEQKFIFPKGNYYVNPIEGNVAGLRYTTTIPVQRVNIDRETTFDKDGWNNFIHNYLQLPGNKTSITLYSDFGEPLNDIHEIIISSIWADEFVITIAGTKIIIPAINADDETIGVQRILFT